MDKSDKPKPGENQSYISDKVNEVTGINLVDLADKTSSEVKRFVNEIDWNDIYSRINNTVKDLRESAGKASNRINESLKTPTSPDRNLEPEAFARQALKNFSFYSSSSDIRLAAEALSKVHEKDPTLAKSIIADARKEPRRYGSSAIDSTEEMLSQVAELAKPGTAMSQGWAKYDDIKAKIAKVLEEPLDSSSSQKRAAELVASMLADNSKCGKETVSELRRSLHLPEYQGKLELAVQDGKALAAIKQQNPADTYDSAWQKLRQLDEHLKKAELMASSSAAEAEKIAASRDAFSRALGISKQATDLRLPYFSGNDPIGKAWEQALKNSRQG